MSTFGERLTQARKDKGLSQKDFAEALGITATRLNYWEKDKREPDIPFLHKICKTLNINGDWLIGFMEKTEEVSTQLTPHEQKVINAYRNQSNMHEAVDRLLGVEPEPDQHDSDFIEDAKKVMNTFKPQNNTKS